MIEREKLEWWGSLDCGQIEAESGEETLESHYNSSRNDDLTKNNQRICIDQLHLKHLNALGDKRTLFWLG